MSDAKVRSEQLVAELERLRASDPVGNPLLDLPSGPEEVLEGLRRLVAIEARAHAAELSAYGNMLTRFPRSPAADLCLRLGHVVLEAGPKLRQVAEALGLKDLFRSHHAAESGAYPFNGAITWASLSGNQAAGALAAHTDMAVYYPGCRSLVDRLRQTRARVPQAFFDYFDDPGDEEMRLLALEVVQDGLDRGDDPEEAVLHARRVEEAIGEVWRTAALETAPQEARRR